MPRDRREYNRAWYERNREKVIADTKAWREADPERAKRLAKNTHLKKKYGITLDDFERMVEEQDGQCAICDAVMMPPHVDHNHLTGKVRRLLCFTCNGALHYLENEVWRTRAEKYLRENA